MKIEKTWEIIAINLQIHRYYLHVYPYLKSKISANNECWDLSTQYIEEKYDCLGDFSKFNLLEKKWIITDLVDTNKLSKAIKLLEKNDFLFFPLLNSAFISSVKDDINIEELHVKIDFEKNINEISAEILKQSSKNFLDIYLKSLDISLSNKMITKDLTGNVDITYTKFIKQYFSYCVYYFYLLKLKSNSKAVRNSAFTIMDRQLDFEKVLKQINHENINDLFNIFLPSSKRLYKYWDGMGIGQS